MSLLISRILITAVIVIIGFYFLLRVWTQEVDILALFKKPSESIPIKEKKLSPPEMSGELIPANKPTPPNACGTIPPNALAILLGNSAAFNSSFPHTVIEVGNQQLLIINKKGDRITISAKFFSRDNRIVGELKENQFYINPNNYFRIERPNEHSLIVYDQEGNKTINLEFLNPSAIRLLGRFYLPNRPPIIIEEDFQTFGGVKMSRVCFGENRVDIHL